LSREPISDGCKVYQLTPSAGLTICTYRDGPIDGRIQIPRMYESNYRREENDYDYRDFRDEGFIHISALNQRQTKTFITGEMLHIKENLQLQYGARRCIMRMFIRGNREIPLKVTAAIR